MMTRKSCAAGFTLVELAIVLMIIGLLIGGILKGQELINNARLTTTMQQVKSYEAAVTTFRDSYNALPGDITNPGTRLPNCTANYCSTGGNGDGNITTVVTSLSGSMTDGYEWGNFFSHMATANLIAGVQSNIVSGEDNIWGVYFPAAKIGGGLQPFSASIASPPVRGIYLNIKLHPNFAVSEGVGGAPLSPNQAGQMDRKMDDGKPQSGDVIGAGAANCTGTDYVQSSSSKDCNLLIRIQG